MPTTSMYSGLQPSDVFRYSTQWTRVTRTEANRAWRDVPIVMVLTSPASCGGQPSWWRADNPLYCGRAPVDARSMRFFKLRDAAACEAPRTVALPPGSEGEQPPDPAAQTAVQCEVRSIDIHCSHTPKQAMVKSKSEGGGKKQRLIHDGQVLEIAPDSKGDEITLAAGLRGGCGDHPTWTVTDPDGNRQELKGREAKFVAKPRRKLLKLLPAWGLKPDRYHIEVTSCQATTKRATIDVYPGTWAELYVTRTFAPGKMLGKTLKEGEAFVGADARQREMRADAQAAFDPEAEKIGEWDFRLETSGSTTQRDADEASTPDNARGLNLKVLKKIVNTASYIEGLSKDFSRLAFGSMADVQGELKLLPKVTFRLGLGYVETDGDARTFFKWRLGADLTVLEGSVTVNWDPANIWIPAPVRKFALDWAARFYLYATLSGEIAIKGNYGPVSPDKTEGRIKGEGSIGLKVGGRLSLMSERVLTADASGNTSITAEIEMPARVRPEFEYGVKWGGLWINLTVTSIFSSAPRQWNFPVVDERKIAEGTWAPFGELETGGGGESAEQAAH